MRTTIKPVLFLCAILFGTAAFADGGGGGGVGTGCRLPMGKFVLMFSAYQPQLTGSKKYCTTLPKLGRSNLVFDFETMGDTTETLLKGTKGSTVLGTPEGTKNTLENLDDRMKEMSGLMKQMTMSMEVVDNNGRTVFERPPEKMDRGTVESVVDFKEAGKYEVHVTLTDPKGKSMENHLAIQVGKDPGETTRNMIIAIVVIFAVLYFIYMSSPGFRKQVDGVIAKLKNF